MALNKRTGLILQLKEEKANADMAKTKPFRTEAPLTRKSQQRPSHKTQPN